MGDPAAEHRKIIMRRLNRLVRSGRPFTVDQIWRSADQFTPGDHKTWLGVEVRALSAAGRIVVTEHRVTEHSRRYSRAVPVWMGVVESERREVLAS